MFFNRFFTSFMPCWLVALCLTYIPAGGCRQFEQTENRAVITVGSRSVTSEDLKKDIEFISALSHIPAPKDKQVREQIVEQIINHYLILEYGRENGISITEYDIQSSLNNLKRDYTEESFQDALLRGYVDMEQWKSRLGEQMLVNKIINSVMDNVSSPSYQVIKEYFEANIDQFKSPRMVEFRQIVTMTKEEAEDILKQLQSGGVMGNLASEYSIAPEAEKGGEVGWVALGDLDESMEKILFSLPVGKISPVTRTPYGYHIFEVISVREKGIKDLPEVIREIESKLVNEKREEYFQNWIKELKTQMKIEINRDMLNQLEIY